VNHRFGAFLISLPPGQQDAVVRTAERWELPRVLGGGPDGRPEHLTFYFSGRCVKEQRNVKGTVEVFRADGCRDDQETGRISACEAARE
jgi:hypothetical protein